MRCAASASASEVGPKKRSGSGKHQGGGDKAAPHHAPSSVMELDEDDLDDEEANFLVSSLRVCVAVECLQKQARAAFTVWTTPVWTTHAMQLQAGQRGSSVSPPP